MLITGASAVAAFTISPATATKAPAAENQQPTPPLVNPNESLSKQLDRNKGVITPPPTGDKDIQAQVPNPNPNPGSPEVIPPPGTPGGNPSVQPK
jgi:hypothetical protein